MTRHYTQPLLVTLRPSPRLKQLIVVTHVIALLAILSADIAIGTKCSLFVLVVSYGNQLMTRLNNVNYQLKHTMDFGWQLAESDADFVSVKILQSSVVTPQVSFLHFQKLNGRLKTLLILFDALPENVYRQLLVRLKTTARS